VLRDEVLRQVGDVEVLEQQGLRQPAEVRFQRLMISGRENESMPSSPNGADEAKSELIEPTAARTSDFK